MKAQLLTIDGKKQKEINLPKIFSSKVREDIVKKVFETERTQHPYGPYFMAGKQHSASGTISHKRHDWKGHYGSGRSRIPRKTMWRRGTQFFWIGAEISSTRGGRRAHPPKPEAFVKFKKINKKEYDLALNSVIAATTNEKNLRDRYARLKEVKVENLPIVVESKITELKTGELIKAIDAILGKLAVVSKKEKSIRAGKGKLRNRKYKSTAGALLIIGNDEKIKSKTFESLKVNELTITDLYPLGRLVIYTDKAIKDLGEKNDN